MEEGFQVEIIYRCYVQHNGPFTEYLWRERLRVIRRQLWSPHAHNVKSVDRYRARWNGDEHARIKEAAKANHDFYLKEWYTDMIKVASLEAILGRKDILNTILMARTWLRMAPEDIAVTLNYLCSQEYRAGGFDFDLVREFREEDVRYLYEYTQSLMVEDYKLWAEHPPGNDPRVEMESGEWNQWLVQMPWIKAYLDSYETEMKISRDADKVGGYKIFEDWAYIAKKKQEQQP
ncbi:MAG: hypothetical protein Q9223_002871 [Gallowayella weberi]